VVAFPQVSPPKSGMHLSFPPYMLHVPPISFFDFGLSEPCYSGTGLRDWENWEIPATLVSELPWNSTVYPRM
jgi:hypothetical protein